MTMSFSLSRQDTSILKGIAICAMLLHHMYACPIADGVAPYGGFLNWIGIVGQICVSIFLFCSGYGLSVQYRKVESWPDSMSFIRRRLIKFYANFWVVYAVFVPITVLVFNRPLEVAYGQHTLWYKQVGAVLLDLFCIPGREPYNVTWCFNQLILILYLLFPLINWFARKAGILLSLIIGFLIFRFHKMIPGGVCDVYMWQFPFLLGILWSLGEKRIPERFGILIKSKWSIIFAVLVLASLVFLRMRPHRFWTGSNMDPIITVMLAFLLLTINGRDKSKVGKCLCFLGTHSINIYLIHTFFNGYWHPEWLHMAGWMRCGINFVVLMSLSLATSLLLEFLKHRLGIYKLSNIIIG